MTYQVVEIHKDMLSDVIQIEVDLKEVSFFSRINNKNLTLVKNYRIGRNGIRQEVASFQILSEKDDIFKVQYIAGSTSFFTQK